MSSASESSPDADPTPEESRRWTAEAGETGLRLDRFLASRVAAVSRMQVQAWIRAGSVAVEGERVLRPSHPMPAGGTVVLDAVLPARETRLGSEGEEPLEVLHEDDELVVVLKPAGMVCHPSPTVRGGTLSERAVLRWGALPTSQGEDRPGIVHRLDRGTSGLVVLARTPHAAANLMSQFRERRVSKRYLALVGAEPRFDNDWIEAPLRRSSGRGDRMTVATEGEDAPPGREAQTFYKTVERLRGYALVECQPRTGRTHQIRVHLESIGHPVLGDELYRGRGGQRHSLPPGAPALKRQALHAAGLRFVHPSSGEELEFSAELPEDLSAVLTWLRAYAAEPRD